jgi:hypothetical protein
MKILREGHRYSFKNFEDGVYDQELQFIEKNPQGQDLVTVFDGTTNEEVLEVLINRMEYLQNKFPCRENSIVITKLQESLMWLNKRTADRIVRNVEGKHIA